jgi:formate dehydrogenase assembly factor FdhD
VEFIYGLPTPELIKGFMDNKDISKHLPKGVTLNIDLPYDTRMAMIAAVSELSKTMVKSPKSPNDLAIGYSLSYACAGAASLMKNLAMPLLIGKAIMDTGAKMKPSTYSSIAPK